MKTIFECEICGYRSEDREKIQRCEARGSKHKFSKGQEVEFLSAPRGLRRWIQGKVMGITFKRKTHKVSYELYISPEEGKKKLPPCFEPHLGLTIEATEENVRSISCEVPLSSRR